MRGVRIRSAALPAAWVAISAIWATVVLVTDQPAWPLAVWIAATVGPLTAVERRRPRPTGASRARR